MDIKKLVIILAIVVGTTGVVAANGNSDESTQPAQSIEIPTYDPNIVYADTENQYGPQNSGFLRVGIELENGNRDVIVYTPENAYPCIDSILVLAPNGVSAEEMALTSKWTETADKEEITIIFAEALENGWNIESPDEDVEFLKTVLFDYVARLKFVVWNERAHYIVGYEDGGTMAHEMAMSYPSVFSGLVSVGGSAVPSNVLETIGSSGSYPFITASNGSHHPEWPNRLFSVPVWIINSDDDGANPGVIDYWKSTDDFVDEDLSNNFGQVYQIGKLNTDQSMNDHNVAEIWVSDIPKALDMKSDLNADIWHFLSRIRRFGGDPGGNLRASFEPEDLGMEKYELRVAGLDRFFYVFTPSSYNGDEEVPMILAFHGYSNTARSYPGDTEMWRVAEQRGFIVVWAQGYTYSENNIPMWINELTGEDRHHGAPQKNDFDFILEILDFMDEKYAIDTTKRYAMGHSDGGAMTCSVANEMPEKFAAVAPMSGVDTPFGYEDWGDDGDENIDPMSFAGDPANYFNDSVKLPYYMTIGDHDFYEPTLEEGNTNWYQIIKVANANSIDLDKAVITKYQNGRFNNTTVYAEDGFAPLAVFSVVSDMPHAFLPEISWTIWDSFFSKYSRGEDGTLYYEGRPVD